MISINGTLVVQVFQFLVLMFILDRLMFRPILKIMNDREGHIAETKDGIENLELETMRLRDEYASREINARKQASRQRSKMLTEGMNEVEKAMDKSRQEVNQIRSTAEEEAKDELKKSRPFLRDEAAALADEIIERVIGRRIAG